MNAPKRSQDFYPGDVIVTRENYVSIWNIPGDDAPWSEKTHDYYIVGNLHSSEASVVVSYHHSLEEDIISDEVLILAPCGTLGWIQVSFLERLF